MAARHSVVVPVSSFPELTDQALQPDAAVGIKEFTRNNTFPCSARMLKESRNRRGQEKEPEADVYVHSAHTVNYVVADELSVDHRKHIQSTNQQFYVTTDCKGWFEVLSQDGISSRPLGSVAELTKLATSSRCLVRQSIGGYVRKSDGYDSQVVHKGDVLTLYETIWMSMRSGGNAFNKQLLRCADEHGQELFLDVHQRGVFTPIAGCTNVSGAHTIKSLLTKFRLPVIVRLLYGNIQQAVRSTYCTGVFKLVAVFSDEILFALPLKARPDAGILPIPTRTRSLKFKAHPKQRNDTVQNLRRQCRHLISRHLNTITSVQALYESAWLSDVELEPLVLEEKKDRSRAGPSRSMTTPGTTEEEELFREIEDIYNAIGCTPNPPVPRPIVFAAVPEARNAGIKRPTAAASKVKTTQQRLPSSPAPKNRVKEDNWQMLQRQVQPSQMLTTSVIHLRNTSDANAAAAADAHVHLSPVPERTTRKSRTTVTMTTATKATSKPLGDHLYEEIPYFAKTDVDAIEMDTQKTMHTTDTCVSASDTSQENVEPENNLSESMVIKEPPSIDHTLTTAMGPHHPEAGLSPKKAPDGSPPHWKRPSRPKSFAGVFFPDDLEESPIKLENLFQQPPPPPLPPKRGESMCNLREEFQIPETRTVIDSDLSETPLPVPESTAPAADPLAEDLVSGPALSRTSATVERRPSSRMSSAVKTLGNVSRSVLKTFRRFGGRSSATFVINSSDEAPGKPGTSSSKDSVARSSSGSSPEPQTLSEKSATGEREPIFRLKPDSDALST